jgi:alpha-L-rhamnosidase
MGDAALTAEEAIYNFDMGAFYSAWLNVIQDDQNSDGSVPNFVPSLGDSGSGAPNWQSAYPSIVWAMWKYCGDAGPIDAHFESLARYYDYFEAGYNTTGLANFQTGFGDWVPPPPFPRADLHLTGAFAFLHDLKMGAEFFSAASNPAGAPRAAHCAQLFTKLAAEFHTAFYDKGHGYYGTGLQTEQAMPLYLGIVPDQLKQAVLAFTVADIETTNSMHTTSGIIGIKCMLEALSGEGRSDIALAMALSETYPSYGYMITNEYEPATTIWELWNSDEEGPGVPPPHRCSVHRGNVQPGCSSRNELAQPHNVRHGLLVVLQGAGRCHACQARLRGSPHLASRGELPQLDTC